MPGQKIGVINTSKELTDILQVALEGAGFEVGVLFTDEIKRREESFEHFLEREKPDIIVYDIAIPYEENYKLFCKIKNLAITTNIRFVLTTTNKAILDSLVGPTPAFEVVGKPFDLNEIVKAVKSRRFRRKNNLKKNGLRKSVLLNNIEQ